jgi:hypothetical protein
LLFWRSRNEIRICLDETFSSGQVAKSNKEKKRERLNFNSARAKKPQYTPIIIGFCRIKIIAKETYLFTLA